MYSEDIHTDEINQLSINVHIQRRTEKSRIIDEISPILYAEFKEFFLLGMKEKSNQFRPNFETIQANIGNPDLSDADFRKFIGTVVEQLLKRAC